MRTGRIWKSVLSMLLLYLLMGCGGGSLEKALNEARAAIETAVQTDAEIYAPWHLLDARNALSEAEEHLNEGAATEKEIMALVQQAQEKADLARAEAAENKGILEGDPDDSDEVAVIDTRIGRIVLEFFPDVAPNHVANFKKLAKVGFYNGTTFHRVIPGFMIQGGNPASRDDDRLNAGTGGPGYTIAAEFSDRPHLRGTLSMARKRSPDSAGCQFFVCVAPQPHLDRQYTVFGRVLQGMEVADQIVHTPRDRMDNPLDRIEMTVSIIDRNTLDL